MSVYTQQIKVSFVHFTALGVTRALNLMCTSLRCYVHFTALNVIRALYRTQCNLCTLPQSMSFVHFTSLSKVTFTYICHISTIWKHKEHFALHSSTSAHYLALYTKFRMHQLPKHAKRCIKTCMTSKSFIHIPHHSKCKVSVFFLHSLYRTHVLNAKLNNESLSQ